MERLGEMQAFKYPEDPDGARAQIEIFAIPWEERQCPQCRPADHTVKDCPNALHKSLQDGTPQIRWTGKIWIKDRSAQTEPTIPQQANLWGEAPHTDEEPFPKYLQTIAEVYDANKLYYIPPYEYH